MQTNHTRFVQVAAAVGVAGPLLMAGIITTLTIVQDAFMRGLGWDPITAPTMDWPSGLALGPYGAWMEAGFIGGGLGLIVFAMGLHRAVARPALWSGPLLLGLAGVALLGLAFKTDPTLARMPTTWHNRIHDASFMLLGATLLPSLLLLARRFRHDQAWRGHPAYTVITLLLVAPAFLLKGPAFYLFLGAVMLWIVVTAGRLWRTAGFDKRS